MIIPLQFCTVEWTDWGCITRFNDGAEAPSVPHLADAHYREITARLGYGDDLMAYCKAHDFCHCFLEERLHGRPSRVLWGLAHKRPLTAHDAAYEELAAQAFQRWLQAGEEPIVGPGVDWWGLKRAALELLAG